MIRNDFIPSNIELWIDNYKRNDVIGKVVAKSWLESFPFEKINVVVNHTSVTIDDFPIEIRDKIKLWPNVMRHNESRGPINKNINQMYIHTFLSGKNYCIVAHDSYIVKPGWHKLIENSDYDFYASPQGDGIHIQTLNGLKTFGWWDERYATMSWHEIDFLCNVLRTSYVLNKGKASVYDKHGLWPNWGPINSHGAGSVGLENYFERLPVYTHPQIGPKANQKFITMAEEWHKRKWVKMFDEPGGALFNLLNGPRELPVNWYPWLDLDELKVDIKGY